MTEGEDGGSAAEFFASFDGNCHDVLNNALKVIQHIARRIAQHACFLRHQPLVARFVTRRPITKTVVFAIDFNREPSGSTVEVKDIGSCRVLPAKP